jgi:Methionyl-tRNA formyltransferase
VRVGFAGCHEISWHCLRVIAEQCAVHGDELAGVFNLPLENGAKHSAFIEFDALQSEFGFPYHKVASLSSPETLALLRELQLDVLFIIGWHRIVPQSVIATAPYCLGMHSSMLPKNRGSSPINWAILREEATGGMTYFHLTAGLDSGDIIGQKPFPIAPDDSCDDAHAKATVAAAELLRENWDALRAGTLVRIPQDESQATVNPRRRPEDGLIQWNRTARELDAWVRGLTHPYPGAFTIFRGKRLLIWKAGISERPVTEAPGTILSAGERISIATGTGVLEAAVLQFEGEPECQARVFAGIYLPKPGERMG